MKYPNQYQHHRPTLLIYFKGRRRQRYRVEDRDLPSTGSLSTGPQELGLSQASARSQNSLGSPPWVAGGQAMEPLPPASQGVHRQEAGIGSGGAGGNPDTDAGQERPEQCLSHGAKPPPLTGIHQRKAAESSSERWEPWLHPGVHLLSHLLRGRSLPKAPRSPDTYRGTDCWASEQ